MFIQQCLRQTILICGGPTGSQHPLGPFFRPNRCSIQKDVKHRTQTPLFGRSIGWYSFEIRTSDFLGPSGLWRASDLYTYWYPKSRFHPAMTGKTKAGNIGPGGRWIVLHSKQWNFASRRCDTNSSLGVHKALISNIVCFGSYRKNYKPQTCTFYPRIGRSKKVNSEIGRFPVYRTQLALQFVAIVFSCLVFWVHQAGLVVCRIATWKPFLGNKMPRLANNHNTWQTWEHLKIYLFSENMWSCGSKWETMRHDEKQWETSNNRSQCLLIVYSKLAFLKANNC